MIKRLTFRKAATQLGNMFLGTMHLLYYCIIWTKSGLIIGYCVSIICKSPDKRIISKMFDKTGNTPIGRYEEVSLAGSRGLCTIITWTISHCDEKYWTEYWSKQYDGFPWKILFNINIWSNNIHTFCDRLIWLVKLYLPMPWTVLKGNTLVREQLIHGFISSRVFSWESVLCGLNIPFKLSPKTDLSFRAQPLLQFWFNGLLFEVVCFVRNE